MYTHKENPNFEWICFDKTESVMASLIKDLCTFALIALCVYVSRDSSWWTFVTGLVFITIVFGRLKYVFDTRIRKFKTKQELIDFLTSI